MEDKARKMTQEIKEHIKALWNNGLSSAEISEKIGLSRNSVIGAVYRMREGGEYLQERGSGARSKVKKPRPFAIRSLISKNNKTSKMGTPVGIMNLTSRSCRFIVSDSNGDVREKYCNKEMWKCSYCKEHYKICYVPAR